MSEAPLYPPQTESDQPVLDGAVVAANQVRALPFVKWAGGKRTLVPEIARLLPSTFEDYWEPFVGGGAVFFGLSDRMQTAHLSDSNKELVTTYTMVRDRVEAVIDALFVHAEQHNRKHYSHVRDKMHNEQDPVLLAARFIYLNKTCFNGLYRVNRSGRFNVPIGRHPNPTICDAENIRNASKVLRKATLSARLFTDEQVAPKEGDLVYCDPPYDGTFSAYTNTGFGVDDQTRLRDRCVQWREAGAQVIVSNSSTDLIRELYHGFTLHEVTAPRYISSDGDGRGKTTEFLIVG